MTATVRKYDPTPSRLVNKDGTVNFGTFKEPIPLVNPLDADGIPGYPIPQAAKTLRLKEWEAFQFANQRFFVFVLLFNGKLVANVQVKIYDRKLKKKYAFIRKLAPWSIQLPNTLLDSETAYHAEAVHLSFRNLLSVGRIVMTIDVGPFDDFPRVVGSVMANTHQQELLVVSIPFTTNTGMYSNKGIVEASGHLSIGSEVAEFTPNTSYVLLDDHKGYYPVAMNWDWVTGGGHLSDGRRVGWNLTRNQSLDPARYNENCLWVEKKAHLLPAVTFNRMPASEGVKEHWEVKDAEGRVDLTFYPEVPLSIDLNLVLISCRYRGPFGYFQGHIVADDGEKIHLDWMFGMGEDFYLRA